jgi:NAD(P)-dependent dehydrogenase (short-subunit alcohol dehydrogenase family)
MKIPSGRHRGGWRQASIFHIAARGGGPRISTSGATHPYQQPTGRPVILVTGASSGIGAAAVRRFAAEGALVAAAARRVERTDALAAELRSVGSEVVGIRCDVTDERLVDEAVSVVVRTFGRLDGAFNNAGTGGAQRPLHESTRRHSTRS